MSHERHCQHCNQWYPLHEWTENEDTVQAWGGKTIMILRTVICPGCNSTLDAHAPPLRDAE